MAYEFNTFFTNVGPNLANDITNPDEIIFLYMGSSTVSDVLFGHFSHALHPGIESATTFSCHTL